jgi:hypothetical protein
MDTYGNFDTALYDKKKEISQSDNRKLRAFPLCKGKTEDIRVFCFC